MSAYAAIDPILRAWARQKGVHVLTHYRDDEIRSVMIYGPADDQGHLWLSLIDEHGMVGVHAAARNGLRTDRLVPLSELADVLTEVHNELAQHVASWKDAIRTRDRLACLTRSFSWSAVAFSYNQLAWMKSRSW